MILKKSERVHPPVHRGFIIDLFSIIFCIFSGLRNGRQQGAENFKAFKEGRKGGGKVEAKKNEVTRKLGSTYLVYEFPRVGGTQKFVPIIPPGSAL